MSNRKRNIQILFCVTPEEKKLIRQKMILSKTRNMGAYLRKMAIDGYIINTDTAPIKQVYEEMHKIGVNINQIARSVNAGIARAEDAKRGLFLLDQVYELMYQIAKK